jgi:hypothetical protein
MEHWLMKATNLQILELEGPLADVVKDVKVNRWQVSVLNPNAILYWVFSLMSVVIVPLLKLT